MFYKIISIIFIVIILTTIACDNRSISVEGNYIANISVSQDTIFADNNKTFSEIRVLVKDNNDFAISNVSVKFKSSIGNIDTYAVTDSAGVAKADFRDNGVVGIAVITVEIDNDSVTKKITIVEQPPIESIVINPSFSSLVVGEVVTIMASAETINGNIPNGTEINFHCNYGFFQNSEGISIGSSTIIQSNGGYASVQFNTGTITTDSGKITITINEMNNDKLFSILPGNPKFMYLKVLNSAGEETSNTNVNGEVFTIEAKIEDSYHNFVNAGKAVSFETTLGVIEPLTVLTDELGLAKTSFSPGIIAGIAEISAECDTAKASSIISIISSEANSIEFDFDGQIQLDVQGTGGQEYVDLQVNLYDYNGNLISGQKDVWFKFKFAPQGTSLDNSIFYDPALSVQDSISVMSTNGTATITVNSGQSSGNVTVKASIEEGKISASKPNIVVQAGAPSSVEFAIAGNDSGEDMGSGMWKVQCSAQITDTYGNPVKSGTVCWFSLPNNPDWASIDAAAFVCNENANGDTLAGQAFTFLNYHGSHTNEEIDIQVQVGQFVDSGSVLLPVQFPQINLTVNPAHIDWIQGNNPNYQDTNVIIQILDGQNVPINNMQLYFHSDKGEPIDEDGNTEHIDYTGIIENISGRLDQTFRFYKYECPPPTPAGAGETSSTMTITILPTGTQNTIDVILRRDVD